MIGIQEQYFRKMEQYKFSLMYWELYLYSSEMTNRFIKIFLATISVLSAAIWLKLDKYQIVWGVVITISQVITAIYDFLPYKKRADEIGKLIASLTPVYNDMEKDWYNVANSKLTEDDINSTLYKHINKWTKTDSQFFKNESLPMKKELINPADKQTNEYFKNRFGG